MGCEHVKNCGFFGKFQSRTSLVWKAMIRQHCEGDNDCVRRVMFDAGNAPHSDDLMPAGVHASRAFLSLP